MYTPYTLELPGPMHIIMYLSLSVQKGHIKKQTFTEVLPRTGMLYTEESQSMVLCKPKIMPLKSVTLEKLEKMQKDVSI